MVEVRRGGADGRSQFREVPTGHEALALAESLRNASQRDEWKDISQIGRNPPPRRDNPLLSGPRRSLTGTSQRYFTT
jgi:hypothetical protein